MMLRPFAIVLVAIISHSTAGTLSATPTGYHNLSTGLPTTSACNLPDHIPFVQHSGSRTFDRDVGSLSPTGSACQACCLFNPVGSQIWTWSQISAVPVTVGTVLYMIDQDSDQTSTTTVLHTEAVTLTYSHGHGQIQYPASSWYRDGTFYSSTLTATKTTTLRDLNGQNQTVVYPTPFREIAASQTWLGQLPVTRSGTMMCLSNNGSASSLPKPTSTPTLSPGTAAQNDPFGIWWTLKPSSSFPLPLSATNVNEYFGGQIVESIYASCSSDSLSFAGPASVNVASFLLDTSTSYGSFLITTGQNPASPTPQKPSPGPESPAPVAPTATGVGVIPLEDSNPSSGGGVAPGSQPSSTPAPGPSSEPASGSPSSSQAGGQTGEPMPTSPSSDSANSDGNTGISSASFAPSSGSSGNEVVSSSTLSGSQASSSGVTPSTGEASFLRACTHWWFVPIVLAVAL